MCSPRTGRRLPRSPCSSARSARRARRGTSGGSPARRRPAGPSRASRARRPTSIRPGTSCASVATPWQRTRGCDGGGQDADADPDPLGLASTARGLAMPPRTAGPRPPRARRNRGPPRAGRTAAPGRWAGHAGARYRRSPRHRVHQIALITRAGLPTATTLAGRSLLTTEPAPTTVLSPMVTPGQTMTPPPSHTLSPIVIGLAASQLARRGSGSTGWVGVSS